MESVGEHRRSSRKRGLVLATIACCVLSFALSSLLDGAIGIGSCGEAGGPSACGFYVHGGEQLLISMPLAAVGISGYFAVRRLSMAPLLGGLAVAAAIYAAFLIAFA
jgi:hypothetical protein